MLHSFPHPNTAYANARIAAVTRIENADPQAVELALDALIDGAIFALRHPFKVLPRHVFAQDRPLRILVANLVVRADELPLGSAAPITGVAAARGLSRPERDASRRERVLERVPDHMRKRPHEFAFGFGVSSAVPMLRRSPLKSILGFITVTVVRSRAN